MIGVVKRVMSSDWPLGFTLSKTVTFSRDFPNFKPHHCDPNDLSSYDTKYNCIAWAASDTSRWWWPDDPAIGYGYWPSGVPREETIAAFIAAYQTLGYKECPDDSVERGFEKIAIFADANRTPTHAARQLPNGIWTSKFGAYEDVRHIDLSCIVGPFYGIVVAYMKRGIV